MAAATGPQWIDDKRLVRPHHLEALSRWVAEAPELVLDYEGDGVKAHLGHRSFMAGFYAPDRGARIVDFRLTGDAGKRAVGDGLRRRTGVTIGHNLTHELTQSWAEGWEIGGRLWDNMAAAFALDERRKSYSQKELVPELLKRGTPMAAALYTWMELNLGTSRRGHELNPNELEVPYNAEDVTDAWDLYQHMKPQVERAGMTELVLTDSEMCRAVGEMQETGLRYDTARAEQLITQLTASRAEVYRRITAHTGRPVDLASHQALFGYLYGELRMPMHKDQEKEGSLDDDVMAWMASLGTPHTQLIEDIRDWRELDKLLGTYLLPWTYEHQRGGFLRGNLNTCRAGTRRFTADDPNLQNIPTRTELAKQIRTAFICEPGWVNYSFDYSQVEYRMFAHYSREPRLVQGYRTDPTFDIHIEVTELLRALVSDLKRSDGKHSNFACLYGVGIEKFSRKLQREKEAARKILDAYHAKIPNAKRLKRQLEDEIRRTGVVKDAFGGRRHLTTDDAYKALNTLCQMSGGDLMRRALVRMYPIIKKAGGKMTLTVHDEGQFKLPGPHEEHLDTLRAVRDVMQDNPEFSVPMLTDAEMYRQDWAHMEEVKL